MLRTLIPEKLAVGPSPHYGSLSLSDLRKEGVTVIVDLNQDFEEMSESKAINLRYVVDSRLKVLDRFESISIDQMRYITLKIHQLILQGNFVYLHCSYAIGRSPTIAAAYLICIGKGKDEAMRMVKEVRPRAWSGDDQNYAALLDECEKKYRGSCTNE